MLISTKGQIVLPVSVHKALGLQSDTREREARRQGRSRDGFASKLVAQAIQKIASLENVLLGERDAVRVAAAKASHGWAFADVLHHAPS